MSKGHLQGDDLRQYTEAGLTPGFTEPGGGEERYTYFLEKMSKGEVRRPDGEPMP